MAKYLDPVTGEFTEPTGGSSNWDEHLPGQYTGGETWTPEPVPVPGGNPTGEVIEPPKSGTENPDAPRPMDPAPIEGNDTTGQLPAPGNLANDVSASIDNSGGNLKNDVSANSSAGYANITGLDTNKLNDPNKQDTKYDAHSRAFSRSVGATNAGNADPSLSPTDPASMQTVVDRLKQNGFPNASFHNDVIDFGDGTTTDVLLNGGQGGWGWLPQTGAEAAANGDDTSYQGPSGSATHASAAPAGVGRPAPPAGYDYDNGGNLVDAFGHPAPGSVSGGGSSAAPSGTSSPYADQIRQMIMARLGELGKPVDENDPQIAQAVSAARDEATRQSDTERTALAEHLYGQGGGGLQSNAITQGIQQSAERNATGIGSLRAKLIQQQYTMKQGQLQQLLQSALQSGDAESARQVQLQMSALDAELRREGYGINLAEFGANLNQQAALAGLNG